MTQWHYGWTLLQWTYTPSKEQPCEHQQMFLNRLHYKTTCIVKCQTLPFLVYQLHETFFVAVMTKLWNGKSIDYKTCRVISYQTFVPALTVYLFVHAIVLYSNISPSASSSHSTWLRSTVKMLNNTHNECLLPFHMDGCLLKMISPERKRAYHFSCLRD